MPHVHFELQTSLEPQAVFSVLTDFGPRRAEVWRNIDAEHFQVHGQGPGWADVTEGSARGGGIWERNRYEWPPSADRVPARLDRTTTSQQESVLRRWCTCRSTCSLRRSPRAVSKAF